MQTKSQSLVEVLTNTFIGFIGSWLISYIGISNISNTTVAVTVVTILCTVWSISRGYAVRRWFDAERKGRSKLERSTVGRDMGQP